MHSAILDLVFPKRSLSGETGTLLTEQERASLMSSMRPILLPKALLKRKGLRRIDAVVAAGSYRDTPLLRQAILTFKFKRMSELAELLGELMNRAIPGHLLPPDCVPFSHGPDQPILCPVPLHWTRYFWRGFNQAELLANQIGRAQKLEVVRLLRRTRPTGHQTRREKAERLTALAGAFAFDRPIPPPPWVVLIDDVCTTGATLDECARALKAAGVKYVSGLAAAYG